MRFVFLIVIVLGLASIAPGANVQWNVLISDSQGIYSNDDKLDLSIVVNTPVFSGQTYLYASQDTSRQGAAIPVAVQAWNSGAWLEAAVGDLVDYSTVLGHYDYWFYEMANGQSTYAYGELEEVEFNKSYYLMFAIENGDDAWNYRLGETTVPPDLYYGWAEYTVDENGQFRIVQSAIDLDGGPMIVGMGAIPEPSSGLLLILGLAGLSLRRRAGSRE